MNITIICVIQIHMSITLKSVLSGACDERPVCKEGPYYEYTSLTNQTFHTEQQTQMCMYMCHIS